MSGRVGWVVRGDEGLCRMVKGLGRVMSKVLRGDENCYLRSNGIVVADEPLESVWGRLRYGRDV